MNLPDQSPLVYLVDDDDAVRDALALLLRSVGLRSAGYGDPQQFLAQLAPQTIGCVVLDIRMPGISGLDVLARLAEASDLPVVMLTGHANVDLCRRAFKGGAMEFLQKPVDDDIFLDAVQTAVRGHIASRERLAVTQAAAERLARLSTREHEVFERIVQGPEQQGDRARIRPVAAHRRNLPRQCLRQARGRLAGAADPPVRHAARLRHRPAASVALRRRVGNRAYTAPRAFWPH